MDRTERRRRVGEEAAEWWQRLQDEGLPRAEREAFVEWLRESHLHIAEMLRMAQVHGALQQFRHWADVSTEGAEAGSGAEVVSLPGTGSLRRADISDRSASRRLFGWNRWPWRAGAALACAGLVAFAVLGWPVWHGQVIETEQGERRTVALEDGSVLQVDPQTRLRVRYGDDERRIELLRGRAMFRVAHNPRRPFLVRSADTTVRAVGTAFGVERVQPGVIRVTVSEGRVAVRRAGPAPAGVPADEPTGRAATKQPREAPADGTAHSTRPSAPFRPVALVRPGEIELIADQQLVVGGLRPIAPLKVDSSQALAWAEGRLVFHRQSIAEAVREFNRYNRLQLKVENPALAARPVSGVFNADDPEAFIDFLRDAAGVRVERGERHAVVIQPATTRPQ